MKVALKEQANAYVNMAGKCQAIFTTQRAVAAITPDKNANQHGEFCSWFSKCSYDPIVRTYTDNSDMAQNCMDIIHYIVAIVCMLGSGAYQGGLQGFQETPLNFTYYLKH